jgi:ankyrin repeat protein
MAAQEGHLSVVMYLVQQGADKDQADINGATPLLKTVSKGHLSVVKYLVQQGADKHKANNNGVTPLAMADHQDSSSEIAQYLRKQGTK